MLGKVGHFINDILPAILLLRSSEGCKIYNFIRNILVFVRMLTFKCDSLLTNTEVCLSQGWVISFTWVSDRAISKCPQAGGPRARIR
jgi:hypothetical protein